MLEAISYGRQVALIFAFHCNHCHATPPAAAAGGLITATYAGVKASIVAGDAGKSPLMEYIDGRRAKRMPLDAPPLERTQIDTIAQWIKEGAREDEIPAQRLTAPLSPKPGRTFVVACRVPARAYLRLLVTTKAGAILHREESALPSGGEARWPVVAAAHWPRQATARVEVMFTTAAARLDVE